MKNTKTITSVSLLQERIEENYKAFKAGMLELDGEILFELAPTIAAARDVYKYTISGDCLEETEAAYLLRYDNPLKVLADAWRQYTETDECEMYDLIGGIVEDDDGEDYMTVDRADELREKYGEDTPIETAIICEIIELGKLLLRN